MTLPSRSHAVLWLRNSGMSRATKETSFSKSTSSSWGSDDDVNDDDAVWNMFGNDRVVVEVSVEVADDNDIMSNIDVIGMESWSIYMCIEEDRYLFETMRLEMKGWLLPMTRPCPIGPIDAIARIIDVAISVMFGCYCIGCEWGQIVNCTKLWERIHLMAGATPTEGTRVRIK